MAERRRCSPSSRDAGPVLRGWRGSQASRCRGEHDALTKWHRKARRHADHVRGSGTLAGEEARASGAHRALPNARKRVTQRQSEGGARGRTNHKMAHALGKNGRGGARAPMATAALCAHGARARERERESRWAQMAARAEAGAAGRSWWPTRARPSDRMLATRQPSSAGSPRRRGAAVRAQTRRGRERGCGEGESAGGLVRLRPAGQK